ncbi:hypothetical protein LCGC14_2872680 [marine sediment metagenome]|uniref:Methyltransferase type 11 domain-containing protein n=1 Tax=marine sediment metagenome TaxID=412755 RepID=A0A0F9ATN7_9ZZZZ
MSTLISEKHRNLYKRHYEVRACVAHRSPWHKLVVNLAQIECAKSILDYGCGPGRGLSKILDIPVADYDPAVPGIDIAPEAQFDIVVANHVLENVEQEFTDAVLEHLHKLTRKVLFFSVSCNPSKKQFADGTRVPRFARDAEWWLTKLTSLFASIEVSENSASELIILGRK